MSQQERSVILVWRLYRCIPWPMAFNTRPQIRPGPLKSRVQARPGAQVVLPSRHEVRSILPTASVLLMHECCALWTLAAPTLS